MKFLKKKKKEKKKKMYYIIFLNDALLHNIIIPMQARYHQSPVI